MRSDNILKADLLDLVFENRNKNYGAYELRKNYRKRLLKALGVGVIFAAGLSSLILMAKQEKVLSIPDTIITTIELPHAAPELAKPKPQPKPVVPKSPAAAPRPAAAQTQWTENIQIVDDNTQASKLPTNLDNENIGSTTKPGAPGGQVMVPEPIVIDGDGNEKPKPIDRETPMLAADVMPAYPGGTAALRKFLEKNLNSPEDLAEGQTITVRVKFIVGYDGKLKGFEILEDGGAAFNKEVIRVLKKMPEWIPGKSNGESVSVYYTIPVKFTPAF